MTTVIESSSDPSTRVHGCGCRWFSLSAVGFSSHRNSECVVKVVSVVKSLYSREEVMTIVRVSY